MLEYATVVAAATGLSFYIHDYLDKNYIGRNHRDVKLIIRGWHLHHSFFGAIAIVVGAVFLGGSLSLVFVGYGLGNIWQHKLTHNRVQEKGMVFVSRVYPNKRALT